MECFTNAVRNRIVYTDTILVAPMADNDNECVAVSKHELLMGVAHSLGR